MNDRDTTNTRIPKHPQLNYTHKLIVTPYFFCLFKSGFSHLIHKASLTLSVYLLFALSMTSKHSSVHPALQLGKGLLTNFLSFTFLKYKTCLIKTLVDPVIKINSTNEGSKNETKLILQKMAFPKV